MNLIIVESPTKARTISKFLGKEYKILPSFGHIRDLPEKEFGVEIENNFRVKYVILPKAKKTIPILKKASQEAQKIILATDEDREGESIAWHLQEVLSFENPLRIVFHEITKPAIEQALQSPRPIDMNLVNAQQARRVLDRLVGYKLSPFLWEKIAKGLSAGRVQSVAVRLIVEREREIEKFKPKEYWSLTALLSTQKGEHFSALLIKKNGKDVSSTKIETKKEVDEILKDLEGAQYIIKKIEKTKIEKRPFPPFTTSTLQQTAWQKFKFPAKLTMNLAQTLYEKGYITYHRTDSLNLSPLSLSAAKNFILEKIGEEYWPGKFVKYKTKSSTSQEAHEAIRPTFVQKTPDSLRLNNQNLLKLYTLIWQRFLASQMTPALFDSTSVEIMAKKYTFKAEGQSLKFDGFLKIYPLKLEEKILPTLQENEELILLKLTPHQHFTQPPPRYTEASLVKVLEKYGIGRPSTYASIISTIQERNYVVKNKEKKFIPTEMGKIVNDLLVAHFPQIVDIGFTAQMEKKLDKIAQGEIGWQEVCYEFWVPFSQNLEEKYRQIKKSDFLQNTNKKCPYCKSYLVERFSKFGKFYACSNFPECRYTETLMHNNQEEIICPKCQKGRIVAKRSKKGKIFYACSNFPECNLALWGKPIPEKDTAFPSLCPKCGAILIEKNRKIICSNERCNYKSKSNN